MLEQVGLVQATDKVISTDVVPQIQALELLQDLLGRERMPGGQGNQMAGHLDDVMANGGHVGLFFCALDRHTLRGNLEIR